MKHTIFAILALSFLAACDESVELVVEHQITIGPQTIDELHQSLGQPIDSISGVSKVAYGLPSDPDYAEQHYFYDRDGQRWALKTKDEIFVGSKLDSNVHNDKIEEFMSNEEQFIASDEVIRKALQKSSNQLKPASE